MAESSLKIERRVDNLERAVITMAQWLVQAQTGFNAKDAEGIQKILRGENPKETKITSEDIAREFHETYERLAFKYEYSTRAETAKPWEEIPEKNKLLMIGVIDELLDRKIIRQGE